MFPHHVVPLGRGYDDRPVIGPQREVRRAYEVPDVLDYDDVVPVHVGAFQDLLYLPGLQMALLVGVAVYGFQSGGLEPLEVVVPGDVPGDDHDLLPLFLQPLPHLADEVGLPGPDGSHEVHGPYPVLLEHMVDLVGHLVVRFEDIGLHSGLNYVHNASDIRTSH